jgi:uncharacterized repeat protein (TIGR01451 family)
MMDRRAASSALAGLLALVSGPAPAEELAQAPATRAAASQARAPSARRAATAPLASSMQARKVVADGGREALEEAANVTIGDVIQYTAQHRNVSQRRLLKIDFGIPIPPGTSYVEGSASPEGARRVTLDKRRDQMLWRVEQLDPGEEVTLSLRVKIDPDPLLTPVPDGPRKPELRRAPDAAR